MAMCIEGIEFFFLIEANENLSVYQRLFQIRPHISGSANLMRIRPMEFTVLSVDSINSKRLYDTKNMGK